MHLKKKQKVIFSITAATLILLLSVIISNNCIYIKKYSSDNCSGDFRIVQISDLHGNTYGKENNQLINNIKNLDPSIICLTGDFIDEGNSESDNKKFIDLLKKLIEISPVYYSYGNHDLNYFNSEGFSLINEIENTGCVVLEEEFIDIDINSKQIRLGGMFDYAFNQQYIAESEWFQDSTYKFLAEFVNTDRTKILMCHRPESFIYDDAFAWDIDYVLCGHTHGGIWHFPFVGGLIAPEQGFFPEYDKGEYQIGNIKMIINSGLSGYKHIPRMFNMPEISVIEL